MPEITVEMKVRHILHGICSNKLSCWGHVLEAVLLIMMVGIEICNNCFYAAFFSFLERIFSTFPQFFFSFFFFGP